MKIYQTIYHTLKQEIADRLYTKGDLLPSEIELAQRFSTSRPTVAKALEMLRDEKLIDRKAGFGTTVLRSELTHGEKIGLLIPQLGRAEIFEPICSAIQEEAHKHYWQIILPSEPRGNNDIKKATELLCTTFIREKCDGVFYTPPNRIEDPEPFNLKILARLKKAGIAVVLLDREILRWPHQTPCDLVGVDNILAGLLVTEHLRKQGCEKLVFAKHENSTGMIDLRIIGAREAIHQAGLPPETLSIVKLNAKQEINPIIQQMPDGLICANDEMAADLMRKLLDAGVNIPGTLRVAGFDDVKYAALLSVPLTTYRQPCAEIGRAAVTTMLQRLNLPDSAPIRVTLQGELITRFSTN